MPKRPENINLIFTLSATYCQRFVRFDNKVCFILCSSIAFKVFVLNDLCYKRQNKLKMFENFPDVRASYCVICCFSL